LFTHLRLACRFLRSAVRSRCDVALENLALASSSWCSRARPDDRASRGRIAFSGRGSHVPGLAGDRRSSSGNALRTRQQLLLENSALRQQLAV